MSAGIILSCQIAKEQPEYIIVNGHFSNSDGGTLKFSNLSGFKKTINVTDDGTFVDTLFVEEGSYMAIMDKYAMPMYFTKGANIELSADANDVTNTLIFKGDNARINNYYAFKAKINAELMKSMQENCKLEEDEYLKLMDKIKTDFENELGKVVTISEGIKTKEKRSIEYFIQDQLNNYVNYHPYFTKKENFEPSKEFKDRQKELDLTQLEDYLYSPTYNQMVFISVMRNASARATQDSIPRYEAELLLALEIANDTMSEFLMSQFAEMRLALMKEGKRGYYDKYLALSKFPEQQQKIKDLYASIQKLEPGNVSPKFVNYENYAGGTTSLDDFNGKYVYIDVWATWCGPCKAEIPFLKEIEAKYHDKNIEFVSVSVDYPADHQKWKDMIAEKEMGGVQLFADAAFNSEFIKDYEIRGIPQFILLDPKGNIIKSQAPRPSEEELITLFESLNI